MDCTLEGVEVKDVGIWSLSQSQWQGNLREEGREATRLIIQGSGPGNLHLLSHSPGDSGEALSSQIPTPEAEF